MKSNRYSWELGAVTSFLPVKLGLWYLSLPNRTEKILNM